MDLIIAEGDPVAVYGVASGTHDGPFMGLPPSGNTRRGTGMAIDGFDAQAVSTAAAQIDGLGRFGQLGLPPPPPGAPE